MKKLFFISCLCLFATFYLNAQTFTSLNGVEYGSKIEWLTSTWDNGFGHRIINSDPGGQTLLNFQGRHNTATWSDIMALTSNGNVGIGTTTPTSKLEISGDSSTDASVLKLTNTSWACDMSTSIEFKTGNNKLGPTSKISSIMNGCGDAGDRLSFFVQENGTNPNNNALVEKLSLLPNGNVGIGTTTPDSKLTVAGKIHSQEVKVTINAGADFVFNDDYNLPTLNSIETFVKKNKHLPEIASEKDMKEKGLYLAEMNIKLLQKIEELTLYAINQEKRIETLETETKTLKTQDERITQLEEKITQLLSTKQ